MVRTVCVVVARSILGDTTAGLTKFTIASVSNKVVTTPIPSTNKSRRDTDAIKKMNMTIIFITGLNHFLQDGTVFSGTVLGDIYSETM